MFKITADFSDLRRVVKWLDSYDGVVSEPKTVAAGVAPIGRAIQGIFSSEGPGWRQLAEITNDLREQRGHPREHPILVQRGTLKRAAADALAEWKPETRSVTRRGNKVSLAASATSRLFTAKISGEKVLNHYGGTDPAYGAKVPARPFFGITDAAAAQAAKNIAEISMEHWKLKGTGVRSI
jgi:hypothetical protein